MTPRSRLSFRKLLTEFAESESRFERLQKQEEAVRARIEKFTAEHSLSRDEFHDRKLSAPSRSSTQTSCFTRSPVSLRERTKKAVAIELVKRTDAGLSVQVLQEFYLQATRPTRPDRISHTDASDLIEAGTRFEVQPMTLDLLNPFL